MMKYDNNMVGEYHRIGIIDFDMPVHVAYRLIFPHDELGKDIRHGITFADLREHIKDVYEFIGVEDSIVRERLFDMLSKLYGVTYESIYNTWMD